MSGVKRFLFWDFPRAGWQYDVMVGLIVAFIFLTPREWFRDQPRANSIVMLPAEHGETVFWMDAEQLGNTPEAARTTEASTLLQVHPTSITNSVSRLERAGMVRREPHPSDGRAVLIQITEPGRALAAEATKHLNAALFTQPGLPSRRLRTLTSVIRDLRREAGDFA